ncbi:MAG: DAK2 domain protein [Firmicutes bacterium ADurb.Bin354]|nr:MAG: DAK2 domain protein [Firmicutes bacterium ADurb.Bin354]
MAVTGLNPQILSQMFLAGAKNLESKKDHINELNVFPVPDGDTGTNMTLTVMSAAKEVNALEDPTMETFCKAVSSGSLRGARGNSGVILSQLFRGFTKVIKTYDEIDIAVISAGCDKAVESAYKAVMQPKEGTILTVAKAIAEKTNEVFERGEQDIEVLLKEVIEHAKVALDHTPELLPVLKEAGVVDSGGAGLVAVLEGFYDGLLGKGIAFSVEEEASEEGSSEEEKKKEPQFKYLYHTSVALVLEKGVRHPEEKEVLKYLSEIGEDGAITIEGSIVNITVNTNDPGFVLQKAIKFGELIDVVVKNRKNPEAGKTEGSAKVKEETVEAAPVKEEAVEELPAKDCGFVAVSAGDGLAGIFTNLGVDVVISGGQTMNPSTDDILKAVERVNAPVVFVFPNNKNIIMAANQARDLSDKKVIVVPTKTVTQGITAMISYVSGATPEENEETMLADIANVKTGQITYAVRDTSIDGIEIHSGDYMGIGDKGILSEGKDIKEVMKEMMSKMTDDSCEVISIYYGQDVKESDAEEMKKAVEEQFPDVDVELECGGQPVYYYIVSAE